MDSQTCGKTRPYGSWGGQTGHGLQLPQRAPHSRPEPGECRKIICRWSPLWGRVWAGGHCRCWLLLTLGAFSSAVARLWLPRAPARSGNTGKQLLSPRGFLSDNSLLRVQYAIPAHRPPQFLCCSDSNVFITPWPWAGHEHPSSAALYLCLHGSRLVPARLAFIAAAGAGGLRARSSRIHLTMTADRARSRFDTRLHAIA